ncbi:unnamed protein product [Menidia menidia]|uniref:(Atlantic silverside) hypothetical protein n=1 Tax=Menidia menidia TaxID=238744 RepID=A0A8S4AY06_9TELE|nr:unnamed protein product [Menidia menidia]
MSSFRFLSLNLLGGSLLLLLTAVCEAQEYSDFAPTPDYDSDYNATFEYSFFSNTSTDDLEKFSEQFIGKGEDEGDEGKDDTGEEKDQEVRTPDADLDCVDPDIHELPAAVTRPTLSTHTHTAVGGVGVVGFD